MDAAILAIGSELLGTDKLDTNSLAITELLERYGAAVVEKAVVGDDEVRIAAALVRMVAQARLVIVTGGLGPTRDDCTRAAAAQAFGRSLDVDEAVVEAIRGRFAAFGRVMPGVNRRQAEVLGGATLLANRHGTAPGQRFEVGESTVFLLPGVPRELERLLAEHLEPWLREQVGGEGGAVTRHVLRVACLAESTVEERLAPFYQRYGHDTLAVLARPGDVRLVLRLAGAQRHESQAMLALLRQSIGKAIYTVDRDDSLASIVVDALRRGGFKLAVAESCTGGMLSEWITRVAGASDVFLGGAVSYANQLKETLVGVPKALMIESGAVSEPVVRAMAEGACRRFGADFGIGITGIAGPGGGTPEKPVGTVYIALAGPGVGASAVAGLGVEHRHCRFPGDRQMVRAQSAQMALDLLRRALLRSASRSAEIPVVAGAANPRGVGRI